MSCSIFTHTIPFPHLSQTGSFCRFPVGVVGLVVGAFTVRVTMGRVPDHMRHKLLRDCSSKMKTKQRGGENWNKAARTMTLHSGYECFSSLSEHFSNKGNMEKYFCISNTKIIRGSHASVTYCAALIVYDMRNTVSLDCINDLLTCTHFFSV